jgi:hypothetical protein
LQRNHTARVFINPFEFILIRFDVNYYILLVSLSVFWTSGRNLNFTGRVIELTFGSGSGFWKLWHSSADESERAIYNNSTH